MTSIDQLYTIPAAVETRWINPENPHGAKGSGGQANGGRKGSPCYGMLKAGQQLVVADYQGTSGVVRHLWSTVDNRAPKIMRGLRWDWYWDGADTPAISVPYGELFGTGLGQIVPFGCALFDSPEGRNGNCLIPMPFRRGVRVTITNETDTDIAMFWAHLDLTINDPLPEETPYLHAYFNRQRETVAREDYQFLPPVRGRGRYLGTHFGVQANTGKYFHSWWGEGEVKLYLDGDTAFPTLCGTGTEDYICTSWGQGRYALPYYGCQVADPEHLRFCFYRYHVPDPVYFHHTIRGAIQQIGWAVADDFAKMREINQSLTATGPEAVPLDDATIASGGLFEREHDDWSSTAFFYLNAPANDLPALLPVAERIADLPDNLAATKRADA